MKMAVMSRILAAANFSGGVTDGVGREKFVAQHIYRELCAADEPNLLQEEDMHVFGLKPMTDPLHLVCCNACKKPVKASQYAAHAELCRSLSSSQELFSELDGVTRQKKTLKKARKKLTSFGTTSITIPEKSENVDASDTPISDSHSDGRVGANSSLLVMAGAGPSHTDMVNFLGRSIPIPAKADSFGVTTIPPIKRPKLIIADAMQPSVGAATVREVKNNVDCQKSSSYVPVPLASKTYYSQRGNRLRAALNHLYHSTGFRDQQNNLESPKILELEQINHNHHPPVPMSYHPYEQSEKEEQFSTLVQIPGEGCVQPSEVNVDQTRRHQPPCNISNQFPVNDSLSPQIASSGMMRNIYNSRPYSFVRKSGTPLQTMQQPDGSVPVV